MKKILLFILCAALLFSMGGCRNKDSKDKTPLPPFMNDEEHEDTLDKIPEDFLPISMLFTTGAGAWSTELTLEADGSFTGVFHDSNMGELDEELYPEGTIYVCSFAGRFENIKKVNDYTYSMTLAEVNTAQDEEMEWIEDGFKYVTTGPYGIEDGEEFLFYLPDAPTSVLTEEQFSWYPLRFDAQTPKKLGYYALINLETDEGFFAEEDKPLPDASPVGDGVSILFIDNSGNVLLTEREISSVEVGYLNDNYVVILNFTDTGRAAFYEATKQNIGKQIAIWVDDILVSMPTVQEAIDSSEAVITLGGAGKSEAIELYNTLTGLDY